jgi:hypothetical protein
LSTDGCIICFKSYGYYINYCWPANYAACNNYDDDEFVRPVALGSNRFLLDVGVVVAFFLTIICGWSTICFCGCYS